MRVPDPIADPRGYQDALARYLGDDDPTEVQAELPAELRKLVQDAGPDLRTRPAAGDWSALECIGHIVGAEIVYAARYRWIVAHDEPPMMGYDQNLWVDRLHMQDADPGELLDLFDALRRANIGMWERSTPEERARVGMHDERGPESYELCFRLVAGHGRLHHEQAQATLEAVRGS